MSITFQLSKSVHKDGEQHDVSCTAMQQKSVQPCTSPIKVDPPILLLHTCRH